VLEKQYLRIDLEVLVKGNARKRNIWGEIHLQTPNPYPFPIELGNLKSPINSQSVAVTADLPASSQGLKRVESMLSFTISDIL